MNSDLSVTVLRNLTEVENVRGIWSSWQNHPNSDVDFYLTVLHSRPEVLRPHVLLLHRGGSPEAMLIGRLEEKPVEFQIGYRTVFRMKARVLTIIYGGRLGLESAAIDARFATELAGSLRRGEADMVYLSNVRLDSDLCHFARRAPGLLCRDHFPGARIHWKMKLPKTADPLYRKLSHGARGQLRKLVKDYNGKVNVRSFQEPDTVDYMIQSVDQIAAKTYQRALSTGFVDNRETRDRLHLAARRGRLRSYILYVEENPCAFWIGFLYRDTYYPSATGYDPRYRKYSPGTFVFMKLIEDLCSARVREIDFGIGDAFYKERFGDQAWKETSIHMFAPTWKGKKLNALRTSTVLLSYAAEWTLQRTGFLKNVKRIWRDRLRRKARSQRAG